MKKLKVTVLSLIAMISMGFSQTTKETADYLQNISVTIKSGNSEGSGAIVTRKIDNKDVSFVWTAAHVVDNLRSTRTVIDGSGNSKTIVEFQDPEILREVISEGRRVGEIRMSTKVLKYSDADTGHDLALLMVRKVGYNESSAKFYLGKDIPPLGTKLFHVGSLLGAEGANSMTSGIVSQIGRLLPGCKFEFDQTSCTAFPGSSGGGIYLENGEYMGMLVRGSGEQFNFIVPVRRMISWAKDNKILWAIDPNEKVPTLQEIENLTVEDIGVTFKAAEKAAPPVNPTNPLLPAPKIPNDWPNVPDLVPNKRIYIK